MFPFNKIIEDISNGMKDAMTNNPMQDFEKNMKIVLQSVFSKLDLVSREEFDVQKEVLIKTREKLDELEQRLTELEKLASEPAKEQTEVKTVEQPVVTEAFSDLHSAMAEAPDSTEANAETEVKEKPKSRGRAKKTSS